MQQQDEDRARADAMQHRREDEQALNEELWRAEEERHYFEDLMVNFDGKLAFFDTVYGVLPEGEDGDNIRREIDNRIPGIYDMLDGFQSQYQEVDNRISDLNFELFKAQQEWDREDEANFEEDAARMVLQKTDYETELTELTTMLAVQG